MMHALTIDLSCCHGLDLCHECERVKPGIHAHCAEHGQLLISGPGTMAHSATFTKLINCCPNRAITIRPVCQQ